MEQGFARLAGYVLAGGRSRRMGRDKALLPWGEGPVLERQYRLLAETAGAAFVIGGTGGGLGLPVVEDLYPGEGPLGGILTAFAHAHWNDFDAILVLACDMPLVRAETIQMLIDQARRSQAAAIMPWDSKNRVQPLTAVYRDNAQPNLQAAFDGGTRRLKDAIATLTIDRVDVEAEEFEAMNTMAEYQTLLERR